MTSTEAAQVIAILVNVFPHSKITEDNARAYQRLILDLDRDSTESAVLALARTSKFFPAVAEIRAAVLDQQAGPARSPEDAWGDVVSEIRRVGSYGAPRFSDPLVAHAVERMGWRNLCSDAGVADRARFCDLFGHARDEARKARLAAPGLAAGPISGALPAHIRGLLRDVGGHR